MLVAARAPSGRTRLHSISLEDNAPPQAMGEEFEGRSPSWLREGIPFVVSPDGRFAVIALALGGMRLIPLDGSPGRELSGAGIGDLPARWSSDGKRLFVYEPGDVPSRIWTLDVASGRRELVVEIQPHDSSGVYGLETVSITSDGRSFGRCSGAHGSRGRVNGDDSPRVRPELEAGGLRRNEFGRAKGSGLIRG